MKLRVQVDDYRNNLHTMIDIAKNRSIKVVLITAPANYDRIPIGGFWPFSKELLIKIHEQYNQIVRTVADERNVALVDLDALVAQQEEKRVISMDGIHFSPFGCRFVAEAIVARVLAGKML